MLIRNLRRDPSGKIGAVVDKQTNNHLSIYRELRRSWHHPASGHWLLETFVLQSALVAGFGSGWHGETFYILQCHEHPTQHFAAIFLDEGRSAGLHLLKDRNCLVFTQGAFPFLWGSLCQGASLRWDILSCWRPQREDEQSRTRES